MPFTRIMLALNVNTNRMITAFDLFKQTNAATNSPKVDRAALRKIMNELFDQWEARDDQSSDLSHTGELTLMDQHIGHYSMTIDLNADAERQACKDRQIQRTYDQFVRAGLIKNISCNDNSKPSV